MLGYFFSRSIATIIDSIDHFNILPTGEALLTLSTFRETTVKQLADYDKWMPDDSSFLDDPRDRRLHSAKRIVYLAIIELIDAKSDAITP